MLSVFFVFLFILQNINARIALNAVVEKLAESPVSVVHTQSNEAGLSNIANVQKTTVAQFPNGIVPYTIDPDSYDNILASRIRAAMDTIEASSCLVFSQISGVTNGSWIYFTNANQERNCVHAPMLGDSGKIVMVIGYDCLSARNILHSVLHALGFKDEVTHPHRDQYVRIIWENIQPAYRPFFRMQLKDEPHKLVEYDPQSVMHFHERAYSSNGGPTVTARMPGLLIAPSDTLSQLNVMKLRVWFGHECNKRQVSDLVQNCMKLLHSNSKYTTRKPQYCNFIGNCKNNLVSTTNSDM